MEGYLRRNFELEAKSPSDEALMRWRSAVSVVKNPRRRFRMIADLAKRAEDDRKRLTLQEKVKVALYVQKAALQFMAAGKQAVHQQKTLPKELVDSGFGIGPDELAGIARSHDDKALEHLGGLDGIAAKIRTSLKEGVASGDVGLRQHSYGFNRFAERPPKGFWVFVWDAFQDLTLMILMVSAAVSIGVGVATEGWPSGVYDGAGILLSIVLVVMVTAVSDYRQSLQFRDLDREKKNILVQVTRDNRRSKISINDLVVGDVVHLSIGDQVAADGVFISGFSLSIDESSLSGESDPVNVGKDMPFLLSGTKVQDGSGKMVVTAVGMRTEWGRLMETLNEEGDNETPLQVKLNGVATIIGKIGLVFAVLTFLVLTTRFLITKAVHHQISHWSSNDALILLNYFAIAVIIIVVAVPEGLPLAVTLSLAFAMKKLMSEKALVRHLSACETMGSATCICTDKTGTLTTNHMVVSKIWTCEQTKEKTSESCENGLKDSVSEGAISLLLQSIFQNTSSEVVTGEDGRKTTIGTPTETALLEFGLHLGGDSKAYNEDYKILKLEPFNSDKKRMSVLVEIPNNGGFRSFCKGASEIVLNMCDKVLNSDGKAVALSAELKTKISDTINAFACDALRTLCTAFRDSKENSDSEAIPVDGYTLIAVVGIKDPVRPGVREAVQKCLDAGITVRMVTGDNINTAKAIARECGILTEDGLAIEGPEFRNKSPEEINELLPKLQVMARSMPLDKHTLVSHLRRHLKEVVAVTGDGTNDAPALHEADIGLSMGISGTEVAKEKSDVIILDDNFTTIVNVIRWGRAVYINIQKFVQFQLTVNIVALMLNFLSACISGSAPLTAVQMLWVNLIMDTLGALALATEPPNDQLMKRPPIGRHVRFITVTMWRNIIGQSIYQIAVLLVLKFCGKKLLNLSGPDSTMELNTVIFNSFVFCQLFNEVNGRDMDKINVFRGIFDSWLFIGVIGSTVAFQAIIVEFLGTLAKTVPLSWQLWLITILIGAVSLPIAVVLKFIPVGTPAKELHQHDGYEALPSGPEQV